MSQYNKYRVKFTWASGGTELETFAVSPAKARANALHRIGTEYCNKTFWTRGAAEREAKKALSAINFAPYSPDMLEVVEA